jgi:hypothetical protein
MQFQIRSTKTMRTPEQERAVQERLSSFQAAYDQFFEPLKRSAPVPQQGQSVNSYRRNTLTYLQNFLPPSSEWKNVSLENCMADSLNAIEPQILREARYAATRPSLLAHTPAAKVDSLDPDIKAVTLNNVTTYWDQSFVKNMGRAGRRVVGFMNNPALMPQR